MQYGAPDNLSAAPCEIRILNYAQNQMDIRVSCNISSRLHRREEPRTEPRVQELADDHYELAWGYPQPGRTFYLKTRLLY